ncbi:hypothetical protein HDU81_000228, partial [Chytriomyces hyalinus]
MDGDILNRFSNAYFIKYKHKYTFKREEKKAFNDELSKCLLERKLLLTASNTLVEPVFIHAVGTLSDSFHTTNVIRMEKKNIGDTASRHDPLHEKTFKSRTHLTQGGSETIEQLFERSIVESDGGRGSNGKRPVEVLTLLHLISDDVSQNTSKRGRLPPTTEKPSKRGPLQQLNRDGVDALAANESHDEEDKLNSPSKVGMLRASFCEKYEAAADKLAASSNSLNLSKRGRHLKQKSAWNCFADNLLSAIGVGSTVAPRALNLPNGKHGINVALLEALWREDIAYRKVARNFSKWIDESLVENLSAIGDGTE